MKSPETPKHQAQQTSWLEDIYLNQALNKVKSITASIEKVPTDKIAPVISTFIKERYSQNILSSNKIPEEQRKMYTELMNSALWDIIPHIKPYLDARIRQTSNPAAQDWWCINKVQTAMVLFMGLCLKDERGMRWLDEDFKKIFKKFVEVLETIPHSNNTESQFANLVK